MALHDSRKWKLYQTSFKVRHYAKSGLEWKEISKYAPMGQTSSMKKFLIFHKTFRFPKQGSVFLLTLESFSSLFCFLKPFCIYSRYSTSQWNFFSELGFTDDCHTYLNISTLAYLLEFHLNEYTAIKTEFLSYSQLFSTLISKFSLNSPFFYYHLGPQPPKL